MLTKQERETIITFNQEEETAFVFTYERSWQKQFEQNLGYKPTHQDGQGGREYEIPKKMIKMPRAPKRISEETRKRLAGMRLKRNLSPKSIAVQEKSEKGKGK